MDKNYKQKQTGPRTSTNSKKIQRPNILESLKDIGSGTMSSVKNDVLKEGSKDFMRDLLGFSRPQKKYSGEIMPGEQLPLNKVFSGEREREEKLEAQLSLERGLREEEKALANKKTQELRLELQAIVVELNKIAKATPKLAQEIQIAVLQAPANPGIYHVVLFEKLLEFIQSFRKKVEDANVWLTSINKRAQKKSFWGMYKKHGGKFLLSSEHYSQRSAG